MAAEEVVGGIVGFLRLDADDFHREITRAIAEVKVLKGMDAKVHVEAVGAQKMSRDLDRISKSAEGTGRQIVQMNRSFSGRGGGLLSPQVIVGGLTAGMALLGPVTGAAAAATAGFVGVLGTGVLAFQGFKAEVEEGTALGGAMTAEMDGLKGAIRGLSRTAATAMAADVFVGLRQLRDYLPTLNDDVGALSGALGRAFKVGTSGLISGLENAMPLLQDGARYAEMLAEGFANFTKSQDFKDFVAYARRELPGVGAAIVSLGGGVKDLAVALAPVGDDLVAIIDLFGKFASATAWVIEGLQNVDQWLRLPGLDESITKTEQSTTAMVEQKVAAMNLASIQSPLATGLGTTNQALTAARDRHKETAQAAKDATLQMQLEGNAAGLLKQSLDLLNGDAVNAATAQNLFETSLTTMGDHVTKTGKKVKFTTTSIKDMSTASVALRGQLLGQIANAKTTAEAYGQMKGSTEEGRKKLIELKQQIIDNAAAHGIDKKAVTSYVDEFLEIPKSVPPTKLQVETKTALDGIKAFQTAINKLHGKSVTASVRYVYTGRLPNGGRSLGGGQVMDAGAKGGLIQNGIRRFQQGGLITGPGTGTSDSILARIRGTGEPIRVANGEFISTDASRRRNRDALEAGNRGATLVATDGRGRGPAAPAQVTEITHAPVNIYGGNFGPTLADVEGEATRRRRFQNLSGGK